MAITSLEGSAVSGIIATVAAYDAFKEIAIALGLAVIYCIKTKRATFSAVGVGRDITVMYDADVAPASLATDFPEAKQVDYLEPS